MLKAHLLICFKFITCEFTSYSDGWIPVTREQVYNQHVKKSMYNFPYPVRPVADTSNKINVHQGIDEKSTYDDHFHAKPYANEIRFIDKNKNRKAKELNNPNLEIDVSAKGTEDYEDGTEEGKQITAIVDTTKSYQVIEDVESFEDTKTNEAEGIGYDYSPPVIGNQNFSAKLTSILSKYNIGTEDKLQNYDLSRRTNIQNSAPRKVLGSFNSLNHLPVDPLLAVFLSNYGFYLPKLYGIKSNYNNLYGYLASNNIHNNRPFGLYKVFSDTDSWN